MHTRIPRAGTLALATLLGLAAACGDGGGSDDPNAGAGHGAADADTSAVAPPVSADTGAAPALPVTDTVPEGTIAPPPQPAFYDTIQPPSDTSRAGNTP